MYAGFPNDFFFSKCWKVVCGHEPKLCCEVVHSEGLANAMELFSVWNDKITRWWPLIFLYVATCYRKVFWEPKLIFCGEVVYNKGLMHAKYFLGKSQDCWTAAIGWNHGILLLFLFLATCNLNVVWKGRVFFLCPIASVVHHFYRTANILRSCYGSIVNVHL